MALFVATDWTSSIGRSIHSGNRVATSRRTRAASMSCSSACILRALTSGRSSVCGVLRVQRLEAAHPLFLVGDAAAEEPDQELELLPPTRQAGGHWFEPSPAHLKKPRYRGVFVRTQRRHGGATVPESAKCHHNCADLPRISPFRSLRKGPPWAANHLCWSLQSARPHGPRLRASLHRRLRLRSGCSDEG